MTDTSIFVGLDVHRETIALAMAPASPGVAFSCYGVIANTTEALRKLCKRLSSGGKTLQFCYEAGPCGYVVQRRLSGWGCRCEVVAPNLIPRKASDRIKNDRRDAMTLAQNLRSDQLTPFGCRMKPMRRCAS